MVNRTDPGTGKGVNERRAQDVVAEAKRRLANQGGKSSQLDAMIQKVRNEFATADQTDTFGEGTYNYQMPNNMEKYLDDVLEMSGMKSAPKQASAGTPSNAPIPTPRPSLEDGEEVDTAEATNSDDDAAIDQRVGEGWSAAEIVAALMATGATAAAVAYAYRRAKAAGAPDGTSADPKVQNAMSALAGGSDTQAPKNVSPVDESIDQSMIEEEKRPAIEQEKRLAITDQSSPAANSALIKQNDPETAAQLDPVDEMIDETMPDEDTAARNAVEGPGNEGRSTQSRFPSGAGEDANEALMERASKMKPRDAVKFLKDNGIEVTDQVFQSLVERAAGIAARSGARQAVR